MRPRSLLAVVVALLPLAHARAESPTEGRLRDALRAAQGQVRAVEEERDAALADEGRLKEENDALKAQLAAARRAAGEGQRSAGLKAKLDELTALLASQREALTRCEAATAQQLDASTKAANELRTRLTELEQLQARVVACDERNAKLYQVGKGIIDWLNGLGVAGAVAAREPFLGLKRVELENASQDFEDKLLKYKATP